jgi:endo-1,4-beta-D-glucanase Y
VRAIVQGLLLLASLCAPALADSPTHPFAATHVGFPPGTLRPSPSADELDAATAAFYDAWKARYVIPGCRPGEFRIKADAGEHGEATTVSEGQGYGLVIVALMAGHDPDAHALFDGLLRYARAHPSGFDDHLMAWAQNASCADIEGRDSATDGDLDIAYGLMLADIQWGSGGAVDYRGEAQQTLAAIVRHTLDPATHLTLLGDWVTPDGAYAKATRASDWMIDHFRVFATVAPPDSHADWLPTIDAHLDLALRMQQSFAPATGLLPDFIIDTAEAPKPAPAHFLEAETDGDFSWNACRTPWRLGVDALVSGDRRSIAAVRKITAWIRRATGDDPAAIGESYRLDGTVIDPAFSLAFMAPFALAAMSAQGTAPADEPGAQAWLDALWTKLVATPPEGYYPDSIKLQVMLAMTGHWWSPRR